MNVSLRQKLAGFALAAGAIASLACSTSTSANAPLTPPDVEVATVEQRDVPIYREWIGTLDGLVNADIKAQVSGYLLRQDYTEGSFVQKGQLLFQIDPRPFQAAVDQAQGSLRRRKGNWRRRKAQLVQAEAQLAQSRSEPARTQLDVERTLRSPSSRPSPSRIWITRTRTTWPRRRRCRRPRPGRNGKGAD